MQAVDVWRFFSLIRYAQSLEAAHFPYNNGQNIPYGVIAGAATVGRWQHLVRKNMPQSWI